MGYNLDAGDLDRRVQLQTYGPSSDDNAEPGDGWVTFAEVWARVTWLGGRELLAAQQLSAEAAMEVEIRWRPGVTARTRILHRDHTYNVVAPPKEMGRRVSLILTCAGEEQS